MRNITYTYQLRTWKQNYYTLLILEVNGRVIVMRTPCHFNGHRQAYWNSSLANRKNDKIKSNCYWMHNIRMLPVKLNV